MRSTGKGTGKPRGEPHPENLRPPWKPGEVPNPKGSSKKARMLKAFREYVTEADNKAVAQVIRDRAKRGIPFFVETFLDRTQGKVPNKNEHSGPDGDPIVFNITAVSAEAKKNIDALRKQLSDE